MIEVFKPDQKEDAPAALSVRSPREILAMKFDAADLLLENGYLTKGDPLVICGAGGIGKSRIITQMAIACALGKPFLGWNTRAKGSRWLLIQTENSNRRLQHDLSAMLSDVSTADLDAIDASIRIHTLEVDEDSLLSLSNIENAVRIENLILDFDPDVVVFDVLRDFATGDLNSDQDMALTCREIGRMVRKGNPARVPLIVHHALTGKSGAARAAGFERSGFGRNSKVLQGWTRAQINIVPFDGESNEVLVVTSGKANNQQEFEPFAIRLDVSTMRYDRDDSVDLDQWREEMGIGTKEKGPRATFETIADSIRAGLSNGVKKGDIIKFVMAETGISKSPAYRLLQSAEKKKVVIRRRSDGLYVLP